MGFLSVILAGALLLYLANKTVSPLSWIDALFTATSAVCVTGLSVVDVGHFAPAGQGVLLLLIQFGGLGIMTVVTAFNLLAGSAVNHYQRLLFTSSLGVVEQSGVVKFLRLLVSLVFTCELLGAMPLFFAFLRVMSPLRAAWYALFHSVSAFCNAGFSLFTANLEGWNTQPLVWVPIICLIVVGGLGFMVCLDVIFLALKKRKRLAAHSRVVLWTTAILIFGGALLIFFAQGLTGGEGLSFAGWNEALFLSVTSRTAGFNISSMALLRPLTLFLIMVLMIIGASPGSTGGGVKTTTLATLALTARSQARNRTQITLGRVRIDWSTVGLAVTLIWYYLLSIFFGAVILSLVEPFEFVKICFDVISALGTVGLSLMSTAEYSTAGKLVLCLLMFWGRVGLLTFIWSFSRKRNPAHRVEYPAVSIPIG